MQDNKILKPQPIIGIYKITNPKNKSYIGQSINIKRRFREYEMLKCTQQPKIYNSLNKYGVCNHIFEILEICSLGELNEKEKYWKIYYNAVCDGLNCELYDNGVGPRGEQVKAKISKSKKGTKGWPKGKSKSEECKVLMSKIAKTQDWRKDVGKKQKGKPKHTIEHRENLKKPIKDLNTNKIYNSCTEAALDLNISLTLISNSLNKLYKRSKWNFIYA